MSRNLCRTDCYYCECSVQIVGPVRTDTVADFGPYADEYRDMKIADAECPACEAKYLAWVEPPTVGIHAGRATTWREHGDPFYDLSFRSSFNDEPGDADLPVYAVEKVWNRVGRFVPS